MKINKKILIAIIVVAAAVVVTLALLVPAFAQAPPEAEPPEITTEELDALEEASAAEEAATEGPVISEAPAPSELPTPAPVNRKNMSDEKVEYKDNKVEYTYHDIVSDSEKKMEAAADTQSDMKFGLEVVAQQLFGQPLDQSPINPNSISLEDGKLYIDFKASIYEANFGLEGEASMLDNIANAYLNNIPEVTEIYYSVDGGNYSTGHFEISGGTPYLTK